MKDISFISHIRQKLIAVTLCLCLLMSLTLLVACHSNALEAPVANMEEPKAELEKPAVINPPKADEELIDGKILDAGELYDAYLAKGSWKDDIWFSEIEETAEIIDKKLIDLDADGVPELWFRVVTRYNYDEADLEAWDSSYDFFCKLEDNGVVVLHKTEQVNASMGGGIIFFLYDSKTKRYVLCDQDSAGGFMGLSTILQIYDYQDGRLNEIIVLQAVKQVALNYVNNELDDPALYHDMESYYGEDTPENHVYATFWIDDVQVSWEAFMEEYDCYSFPEEDAFKMEFFGFYFTDFGRAWYDWTM